MVIIVVDVDVKFIRGVFVVTAGSVALRRIGFHILIGIISGVSSFSTSMDAIIDILWGELSRYGYSCYKCIYISTTY